MKYCFELLEKCLFILILTMPLTHVAMASDRTKYVSLNNHWYMNMPSLTDLNTDENNQGLCHYPFLISLDVVKIETLFVIC